MTIDDLIDLLERRRIVHGNIEVQVTWEGQIHSIDKSNVYAYRDGKALLIDADDNFYKKPSSFGGGFALDPNEGES